MSAPILATKLYVPPSRPKVVLRPRLTEQLNESLSAGCKLTLISAAAGFGKTTLVSEWLATCDRSVAWLSLDEGDQDPIRFLTYLIAALQTIAPNLGAAVLGALQSPQPPSTESLLTALLNEIAAIPNSIILVLDDYHVIDSQSVDQALIFLVEHLPPRMHLVIASREDPPLALARLRARGQLAELRAAELRFTPAEAADFLNRMMGLNLRDAEVAALEARTEGWIAGLQLAALSMQGRSNTAGFIRAFTGSHRFVLDYLIEEVLQHQPEPIRNFLLETALLDRFCASLCNAVTKREDGKEMLDILERGNLFLIPLDDERQWHRYHHLFADVLRAHLTEAQHGQVASLHQRASTWYEQNGSLPDAIYHALAAKDFERAARLIELAWPAAEEGSIQPAVWLGWVKTLPDELVRDRPVLSVWYAYALLGSGELEAAEAQLQNAERWLESADISKARPAAASVEMVAADRDQSESLLATIAVGRAYIAQALGNIPDTVRYASQVLELAPEGDHLRRGQASMLLGMTHWVNGDLEAADRVFSDYTMRLRKAGNIPDAISTAAVLGEIRLASGHLHEAIDTVEQCLRSVVDQRGPIPPDIADLHRELSELYLEQGNLEAAAHHLQSGRELGEQAGLPVLRYRLCVAQARLHKTQADLDAALEMLNEAERLYIRSPLPDFYPIAAMKARIWVAQGRLTHALAWARERDLLPANDLPYLREFEQITLARILISQYQNDRKHDSAHAAMRLLDRLLRAAEEGNRMGSVIEILVLQALARQAQEDIKPALVLLERALTLAEPEGYVRIFVDEGKPVLELLTRMAAKDGTPQVKEHIRKLLSAFEMRKEFRPFASIPVETNQSSLHAKQAVSPQPLIEPLSERELDVLRLLSTDLNGPEIARELMVSLSTVRTHTQHIYAKLRVDNRRFAVRRAEELGLL